MKPLRVGLVTFRLSPGGSERQMLALATHLPRDRFAVDVLSLSGAGPWDDRVSAAGAGLIHIGSQAESLSPWVIRGARRALKVGRYIDVVRAGGYDVIDAWVHPTDVLAVATRAVTRTPVVVSGRRHVELLNPVLSGLVGRYADAVVANSARAAEFASRHQRIPTRKLVVIRNGVEAMEPISNDERSSIRIEFGASNDQLIVGCVANFYPVKGHRLLLEAFAHLIQERDDLRLVLVGDGPLRREIESTIRMLGIDGFVCLLGAVPDPKRLYGAFDVVVQTSSREGLPNALLEAAASGRAMVATAAGGTDEIVRDGQTGLLVPIEDISALVRALRQCLADPALRARLGKAAGELATNEFGVGRFVDEFASLYESLVMRKRRSQPDPGAHRHG